jgi:hypothetical protein
MITTSEETLSSSDARAAILHCHDELRGLVSKTMHAAERASISDRDFEPLRAHARHLYQAFEAHMDFGERILSVALRDVIGRGSLLAQQVVDSHERRRATLALARSALQPDMLPHARVVASVRALADTLLRDLRSEERTLYTADLDATVVDGRGG